MSAEMPSRKLEILLVEDSPTDVLITQEALKQAKLVTALHVVEDGVEALAFLHREGKYESAPRPDLIVLDLNMPRKNGREVLAEIKVDPNLMIIPVIVLTTSNAEEDILQVYTLHANCYVVKPIDFRGFVEVIRSIRHFWSTTATLPPSAGGPSRHA